MTETTVRGGILDCKSIGMEIERDTEVVKEIGTSIVIILAHHHVHILVLVLVLILVHILVLVLGLGHVLVHVLGLGHIAMIISTEGHFLLEGLIHLKTLSPRGNLTAREDLILVHEEVIVGAGRKVASVIVIMIHGREIEMRNDTVTGHEWYNLSVMY